MHVGYGMQIQSPSGSAHDREAMRNEIEMAEMAESLGYESIWLTEHHFTDYSLSPDPLQLLSYFAGRTKKALLGTKVLVMPWHNPLRVAEQIALLDHVSGGRYVFGFGRGAARVEFERFGIDMSEARGRFIEGAEMVIKAFDTGIAEYDGKFIKQPPAAIRPAPFKPLRGRTYAAAASPESFEIVARLGAGLLIIPQKPWDDAMTEIAHYREVFRAVNGREAPPPIVVGWVVCDESSERAYEHALKYINRYYKLTMAHYEMRGEHFADKAGYEYYNKMAGKLQKRSDEALSEFFLGLHAWGTPEQCYDKIVDIQKKVGNAAFVANVSFGGQARADVEKTARLFAAKVAPELRKLDGGFERAA
jgi:alkanesulfonate monooxygenase SsuD/methylene tetrahydromethanopterin reductase-like flavin-dependent oxidoreductase (luciferase family)